MICVISLVLVRPSPMAVAARRGRDVSAAYDDDDPDPDRGETQRGATLREGSRHREGGQSRRPKAKGRGFDRSSKQFKHQQRRRHRTTSTTNSTATKDVVKRYESASLDRNDNQAHTAWRIGHSDRPPVASSLPFTIQPPQQRSHRHRYVQLTAATTTTICG